MALYQPINVYPNNATIDLTENNIFRYQLVGSTCNGYTMNIFNQSNVVVATSTKEFTTPLYGGDVLEIGIPAQWYSGYMVSGSTTTYMLLPLGIPGSLSSFVGKYIIWINGSTANKVPNKITSVALSDVGAKAYVERTWTTAPTTSSKYIIASGESLLDGFEYKDIMSNGETLYHQIQLDSDDLVAVAHGNIVMKNDFPTIIQNDNIKIGDVVVSGTRSGRITGLGNRIHGWTRGRGSWYNVEVSSDFTPALSWGDYYEIYSGSSYVVNNYIFYTKSNPKLTLNNAASIDIDKPEWTFTATYTQEQNVGIVRQKWELYVQDDVGYYQKIEESDYLYTSKLEYHYSGLINSKNYKIVLTVENESKYKTTTERKFTPSYSLTTLPDIAATDNKSNIEINLQGVSKPVGHSKTIVYKEVVGEFNQRHIVDLDGSSTLINDYNVSCGYEYKYHIYLIGTSTINYVQSQYITPRSKVWFVIGLQETTKDGVYNVGQVWSVALDVQSGDQTANFDKTTYKNLGRFPKTSYGNSNYITGSLTFKLGSVSCDGEYQNDNPQVLRKLRDFANDGSLKLLKDSTGQIFVVDIDSLSNKINDGYIKTVNDISLSYTEISNANNISVVKTSN